MTLTEKTMDAIWDLFQDNTKKIDGALEYEAWKINQGLEKILKQALEQQRKEILSRLPKKPDWNAEDVDNYIFEVEKVKKALSDCRRAIEGER